MKPGKRDRVQVYHDSIIIRWYHGGINPEVVEEMLLSDKGQDGSFLVRASYKSPGDYSLSVRLVKSSEKESCIAFLPLRRPCMYIYF